MVGLKVDVGTGIDVAFATSGFNAQIIRVGMGAATRDPIEKTTFKSPVPGANQFGGREFFVGRLADPGDLTLQVHVDTGQADVTKQPLINQAEEQVTFTFPKAASDSAAAKYAGTGMCTSFEILEEVESGPEAKLTAVLTIKWSGLVTITPAVAAT